MKIRMTSLIILLVLVVAACQNTAPGYRAKCEEVLDWLRQQKDCTVEPIGDGQGGTTKYIIYWKFDLIWFDLSTKLTDITWDYRSGTLKQLNKIKEQYIEEERKARQRTAELLNCKEVLDWFREQEYCTVKPIEYSPVEGYRISWRIKHSEPPKVIWDGNIRTTIGGRSVDMNGGDTWSLRFGTYEDLEKLKKRFENDKTTFGPKKVESN